MPIVDLVPLAAQVIAGLEPEHTNVFLQLLSQAGLSAKLRQQNALPDVQVLSLALCTMVCSIHSWPLETCLLMMLLVPFTRLAKPRSNFHTPAGFMSCRNTGVQAVRVERVPSRRVSCTSDLQASLADAARDLLGKASPRDSSRLQPVQSEPAAAPKDQREGDHIF